MSKALSYADAVRLLGGEPSNRIITMLDRLAGGALLAFTGGGSALALSLFDSKAELFRLSRELVTGLSAQLRGASRIERGEQLSAAHTTIVVTAFFDAIGSIRLPFPVAEFEFTASEQVSLAVGGVRSDLGVSLLRTPVPVLTPYSPYEAVLQSLYDFYFVTARNVLRFVTGLAIWDRLSESDRQTFESVVLNKVPAAAVRKYEDLFRQLATEFPEVAFWAGQIDQQATRAEIRKLQTGLAGLAEFLAARRAMDEGARALSQVYQAALRRPLLPTAEAPGELRMPTVAEAYVNPHFRVAANVTNDEMADEYWWSEQPRRADLQEFLVAHLTCPSATEAPLLILGQPGSGKSLLTQVVAARLPASEFLAVRIPLREVSANADLQTQIEQAIRAATGESSSWRDLLRSAGDTLPVLLLDGFDELLQATGSNQSDYLERIAQFQQREADLGSPVVVLVTSRISVADRARPVDGMVALLLEPFDDAQMDWWLEVWNQTNATQLSLDVVLEHADLARQPLLLLLLALYDATGNDLRSPLSHTELYERLLKAFVLREVRKLNSTLPSNQADALVEQELLRLSVTAFAMFNRHRLWVTEAELDADLAALGMDQAIGWVVLSSFYFVHTAQAMRDDIRLKTYEFLHTTFGEYLIARLVVRELCTLIEQDLTDDSFLHALMSFAPFTMRNMVVWFLGELLEALPIQRRSAIRRLLLSLFHGALERRGAIAGYQPVHASVLQRHAAFSVDLCLLAAYTTGEVSTEELFPSSHDPVKEWIRITTFWMSQLPIEGRHGLVDALHLRRLWDNDRRRIVITHQFDHRERPHTDPFWSYRIGPGDPHRQGEGSLSWVTNSYETIWSEINFICSVEGDTVTHALEPFGRDDGQMITTFHDVRRPRKPVSAAHALITLWLASGRGMTDKELADAHETCLRIADRGFAPYDTEIRRRFRILVLSQLRVDRDRLPSSYLNWATDTIMDAATRECDEGPELVALTRQICPGLLPEQLEPDQAH